MRFLNRPKHHRHFVELVELATGAELLVCKTALDDLQSFRKLPRPGCRIDAIESHLNRRHTTPDTELEPAAAQMIDDRARRFLRSAGWDDKAVTNTPAAQTAAASSAARPHPYTRLATARAPTACRDVPQADTYRTQTGHMPRLASTVPGTAAPTIHRPDPCDRIRRISWGGL